VFRNPNTRALLAGGASALALCLAAPAAFAQGPTPDADGDRVVIVGVTIEETLPQELEKYGSDLEVVTSEEIRNQVYVDAQQALQMKVPGLFVATRGGPFSYMDISLQGSRTQDMLLLVDGVRINNRLYSTTMSDTLPASMIERIEVLKGGQGLYYGTQSAAGVINIVTRGYTDDFNGLVNVGADTNDGRHIDGYVRGKAGPGNYVLFASHDKGDGFETYDAFAPSTTDRNRSYDLLNYGGKYRFELGDRIAIDARYQHTDAAVDNTAPRLIAYSVNERDEDIASIGVDIEAADWAQVFVKGYWHDWDSTYTTIQNQLANGGAGPGIAGQVTTDLNTFWGFEDKGINALAKLTPGGPFEYLVGYDYQQYSGKDDVLLIAEQEEDVHAVFGQLRSTDDFIKNGSFAIGARHSEGTGSSVTVWNASARYDFTPWLYAQGNVGTSYLLPTAEQLYAVDPFSTLGNSNLEAEEGENLNVGFGGEFDAGPALSWQATYFSRDIENRIQFEDCGDGTDPATDCATLYPTLDPSFFNEGFYRNLPGTVEVRGFELTGAADFKNGFSAVASYTDTDSTVDGGAQLARIPRTYGKVGGSYDAGQWGADVSALWVGELKSTSLAGGVGVIDYGDYVVLDVAAHVFIDADQKHKLTARLENALDEEYRTGVGRSAPSAGNDTTPAFVFGFRGVPQTLRVSYSYAF
jgi:outer membrane cobalamin receptor